MLFLIFLINFTIEFLSSGIASISRVSSSTPFIVYSVIFDLKSMSYPETTILERLGLSPNVSPSSNLSILIV